MKNKTWLGVPIFTVVIFLFVYFWNPQDAKVDSIREQQVIVQEKQKVFEEKISGNTKLINEGFKEMSKNFDEMKSLMTQQNLDVQLMKRDISDLIMLQ